MTQNFLYFVIACFGCLFSFVASKIDCYVCASKNGSNSACDDPFHPYYNNLSVSCRQGMDGRYGLFPARFCIKMKGRSSIDGTEMVMRYCAMKTLDNMCGLFKYEDVHYTGCIVSCDKKACNGGNLIFNQKTHIMLILFAILVEFVIYKK